MEACPDYYHSSYLMKSPQLMFQQDTSFQKELSKVVCVREESKVHLLLPILPLESHL